VVGRVDPATGTPVLAAPALVRSKGSELGARTDWIPGVQSSVALWRLTLASELVFAGDAGTTAATRPSLRRGIEWSNRYRATSWLALDGELSLSRARFRDPDPAGDAIPGSIERVLSLGATVENRGAWSGALQMRYFGPRPLIEDRSVASQSTLLWNSRLAYRVDHDIKVALDVLNLFNRRASDIDYFYASQLRGEAAAVRDVHFHPVEPRAVRLSLVANF
jgi:outer membrane receptor protein involved in Fe transport